MIGSFTALMRPFNYWGLLTFIFLRSLSLSAQDTASECFDVSKIRLATSIARHVKVSYVERHTEISKIFGSLTFQNIAPRGFIPNDLVTKKAILRFDLCNHADTQVAVWFFPGLYCSDIHLYRATGNHIAALSSIEPDLDDCLSYRQISLGPHDSVTIIGELRYVKTYLNAIRPRLIHPGYLSSFIVELRNSRSGTSMMTYVFCGLLLMMILYSIANFLQGANKEFLFYSAYAFFLGLMFFLKMLYGFRSTSFGFFQEGYLDFILQDTGYLFYMIFMKKYLATKTDHPFLDRLFNGGIFILTISIVSYSYFHYFSDDFVAENASENTTKILLLLITFTFIIYSFRHSKNKQLRYLFWGNLCLFTFSLLSQLAILLDAVARKLPGIFQSSLFYYEIGLFLELAFFLMALNYKSKGQLIAHARETERLKAENLMKEYEKELAVFKAQQQERERISADMHDELGSGMTAIRLMSEIARNKMKGQTPAEIEKISQSADEVLNKMNAIIWSMNSGNDTMDNLVSYIRSYALEYFENTPVQCKVNTPEKIEAMELSGDKRRNMFLCIKETLNNTLKHARASSVKIDFHINKDLLIRISDDGIGIDKQNLRQFGNGLKNIARRMESIGGTYTIENGRGTITTLSLPL